MVTKDLGIMWHQADHRLHGTAQARPVSPIVRSHLNRSGDHRQEFVEL